MTQPPPDDPYGAPPSAAPSGYGPPATHGPETSWSPVPTYETTPYETTPYDPSPYGPTPYGPNRYGPGPGAIAPAAVPLPALPTQPVEYHQMLRTPRERWWKGLLMIVSFVAAYLVVSVVLQGAAVGIDVATGRVAARDLLSGKLTLTPTLLLAVNLTNVASIPLSMALQRAFFGQRGRWLHSVTGRFRWRVLGRAALFVVPIWVVYLVLTQLSDPARLVRPHGEGLALLVVVVLTTPLQSAGEEYGARGLITRAAGSWLAGRRAALVVSTLLSSVVFMLAHGAGDPWLIGFYFGFGVVVSLVTWRTGGLEVAVLLHASNNLIAFGAGILTGQDLSQALDRSDGTGSPAVLVPLGALLLSLAGVWIWTRVARPARVFVPEPDAPTTPGPLTGPWTPGTLPPAS